MDLHFFHHWKKRSKERCKNVLSSEAGTQILQITQWTRYAQTAFRISLLRLRPAIRDSISIQRICIPLKTSSCGMFLSVSEETCSTKCGNREALATNGTQVLGYAAWLVQECFWALTSKQTIYVSRGVALRKTFRTRRSLEDVLLSESLSILVSRKRDKQIDMRSCLSEASSSNDYDNITSGLRAQDVFLGLHPLQ
jgi:hypothetical protein